MSQSAERGLLRGRPLSRARNSSGSFAARGSLASATIDLRYESAHNKGRLKSALAHKSSLGSPSSRSRWYFLHTFNTASFRSLECEHPEGLQPVGLTLYVSFDTLSVRGVTHYTTRGRFSSLGQFASVCSRFSAEIPSSSTSTSGVSLCTTGIVDIYRWSSLGGSLMAGGYQRTPASRLRRGLPD